MLAPGCDCNAAAHKLVVYATNLESECVWFEDTPEFFYGHFGQRCSTFFCLNEWKFSLKKIKKF